MRFVVTEVSAETALGLINAVDWDYPFCMDYERYLLVTDCPCGPPQNAGEEVARQIIIILSVSGSICGGIMLLKYDGKMLNYLDLLAALNKLPIAEYRFGAERRLGDKYRFITKLLGGRIYENYDGFYYHIDTETARKRFYMILLKKMRRNYKCICERLERLLCDKARSILDAISIFMENSDFIPADTRETIIKQFSQYIDDMRGGMISFLEDSVNEKNDNCVALLEKDDDRQELDAYMHALIRDKAWQCYTRLSGVAVEAIAYLEYIKGKDLDKKRAEAKKSEYEREVMQRLFYKPAPYEECFVKLEALHQFLHDNGRMPKMQAATCEGCGHWGENERFCGLYQCSIDIVPFGCEHWTVKRASAPGKEARQRKSGSHEAETAREKCRGCACYIERENFCEWIKAAVPESGIAGCIRPVREARQRKSGSHEAETAREKCRGCVCYIERDNFCEWIKAAVPESGVAGCIRPVREARQRKSGSHEAETAREKCRGCACYIERENFCEWIKAAVPESVAGCAHYKTVREVFPYCPCCGRRLNKTDVFCGYCGARAYGNKKIVKIEELLQCCTNCGKLMDKMDLFCGYCGTEAYDK